MAKERKYKCTCYKCGKKYTEYLTPEVSEMLFTSYDPTDFECPDCFAFMASDEA